MKVNTYLHFNGNCKAAFEFYEKRLGGKVIVSMTHEGSPMEGHVKPEWRDKILHARLALGDTVLLGSDSPPEFFFTPAGFSVTLSLDTPEEADRIFTILLEGGIEKMAIQETFFAHRFGMLVDQFGIPWMVINEKPD